VMYQHQHAPLPPGHLDAHPLVREYFGEQLRSHRTEAWKECNRRLYNYYRTLAPQLPATFREMEPLFLAVACACNAGLFREALHEVYIPAAPRGLRKLPLFNAPVKIPSERRVSQRRPIEVHSHDQRRGSRKTFSASNLYPSKFSLDGTHISPDMPRT
jgi:hypothetical protein